MPLKQFAGDSDGDVIIRGCIATVHVLLAPTDFRLLTSIDGPKRSFLRKELVKECKTGYQRLNNLRQLSVEKIKSGTGDSLHTQEPVTVASFRTWRGWREYVA